MVDQIGAYNESMAKMFTAIGRASRPHGMERLRARWRARLRTTWPPNARPTGSTTRCSAASTGRRGPNGLAYPARLESTGGQFADGEGDAEKKGENMYRIMMKVYSGWWTVAEGAVMEQAARSAGANVLKSVRRGELEVWEAVWRNGIICGWKVAS